MNRIVRASLALAALAAGGTAGSLAQAAPMKLTSGQMDKVTAGQPIFVLFSLGDGIFDLGGDVDDETPIARPQRGLKGSGGGGGGG